ncbi:hypothetical protein MTsPCn5_28910 [Croceitalea sp. MTPC5]|nr:hypothetical protein MTsPCn5_28910 [Croceitalea sp. MTPC5]
MKTIVLKLKKEFTPTNRLAAISCLIISITIYFIMAVLGREIPL